MVPLPFKVISKNAINIKDLRAEFTFYFLHWSWHEAPWIRIHPVTLYQMCPEHMINYSYWNVVDRNQQKFENNTPLLQEKMQLQYYCWIRKANHTVFQNHDFDPDNSFPIWVSVKQRLKQNSTKITLSWKFFFLQRTLNYSPKED